MHEPDPNDEVLSGAERELARTLADLAPAPVRVSVADVAYRHGRRESRAAVSRWRVAALIAATAAAIAIARRPAPEVVERIVERVVEPDRPDRPAPGAPPAALARLDRPAGPSAIGARYLRQRAALLAQADDALDPNLDETRAHEAANLDPGHPLDLPPLLRRGRGMLSVNLVGSMGDPL